MARRLALCVFALGCQVVAQAKTNAERLGPDATSVLILVDTQRCAYPNGDADPPTDQINHIKEILSADWDSVVFVLEAQPPGRNIRQEAGPFYYDWEGRLCGNWGEYPQELINPACPTQFRTQVEKIDTPLCIQGHEGVSIDSALDFKSDGERVTVVYKGTNRMVQSAGAFGNMFESHFNFGPQDPEVLEDPADLANATRVREAAFKNNAHRAARAFHSETGLNEWLVLTGVDEIFLAGYNTDAIQRTVLQANQSNSTLGLTVFREASGIGANDNGWDGVNFINQADFDKSDVQRRVPVFPEVNPLAQWVFGGIIGAIGAGAIVFFIMTMIADEE